MRGRAAYRLSLCAHATPLVFSRALEMVSVRVWSSEGIEGLATLPPCPSSQAAV